MNKSARTFWLAAGLLTAVRLYAAKTVGFGDSEALYASYGLHPQIAYLDHPGLVGMLSNALRSIQDPITPSLAHLFSSLFALSVPAAYWAFARAASVDNERAWHVALLSLLVPEFAIGLFALTPDLLLAPLWLVALALLVHAVEEAKPSSAFAFGIVAALATMAKVSGAVLFVTGALVFLPLAGGKVRRDGLLGLAGGALCLGPLLYDQVKHHFPMLHHRLVATQSGAGFAIRNLGALIGGQLLYVSPILLGLAVIVFVDLARRRNETAVARMLFHATWPAAIFLALLSLWSPVAEPHWFAPALLALPIHAARRAGTLLSRAWLIGGFAVAEIFSAAVYAWVLIPTATKLLPKNVDARTDISNELYGWPSVIEAVRESHASLIVAPHWVLCAQLQAGLGASAQVGCATPIGDDFENWVPRSQWMHSKDVLWVTDARFPQKPDYLGTLIEERRVVIYRGGRPARTFVLSRYEKTL